MLLRGGRNFDNVCACVQRAAEDTSGVDEIEEIHFKKWANDPVTHKSVTERQSTEEGRWGSIVYGRKGIWAQRIGAGNLGGHLAERPRSSRLGGISESRV